MHPEYAYPCNSMQRSGCRVTVELFPSPLFLSGCFPPCFCKSNQWLRPDADEKPQLSKQSVSSLQHDMFKMTCRSKKKRRPDEFGGHHSIRELQDERCPNMTEIQIAINIQHEICHFAVEKKCKFTWELTICVSWSTKKMHSPHRPRVGTLVLSKRLVRFLFLHLNFGLLGKLCENNNCQYYSDRNKVYWGGVGKDFPGILGSIKMCPDREASCCLLLWTIFSWS